MSIKMLHVTLTGGPTGVIFHNDNLAGQKAIDDWRKAAKDRKQVKGDDRSPPWTWKTYLYSDGQHVVLPSANLQSCIVSGAAEFKAAGKRASLKRTSAAALRFAEEYWEFIPANRKKPISTDEIDAIDNNATFEEQAEAAAKLGILIDVRRATIGKAKHVRTRPRFAAGWRAAGTVINSQPDLIDTSTLQQILTHCGDFVGLGDWRPGSPSRPGPHGRFTAEIKALK